jgi:hypothetical protein
VIKFVSDLREVGGRATPENEGQRPSCISNANRFLSILLRPFDLLALKDCLITELSNHLTLNEPDEGYPETSCALNYISIETL